MALAIDELLEIPAFAPLELDQPAERVGREHRLAQGVVPGAGPAALAILARVQIKLVIDELLGRVVGIGDERNAVEVVVVVSDRIACRIGDRANALEPVVGETHRGPGDRTCDLL